jgi:cytidine deaminase
MTDPLLSAALAVRENAFAPFSKFKVGAALEDAADTDNLTPPCGACRQILWEFCGDVEIVLVNLHGKTEAYRLKDLFPKPFDVSYL